MPPRKSVAAIQQLFLPVTTVNLTNIVEIEQSDQTLFTDFMAVVQNYNEYIINAYAEKATEHDDDDIAITDSLSDMIDIDNEEGVMKHPAELHCISIMENATGKSTMSSGNNRQIVWNVSECCCASVCGGNATSLVSHVQRRQPTCQLWFDKNEPEKALPCQQHL